ncbi:T9SS type A sorting domain-containing protein [Croceimicrobium hydrocarbonivorans]|uniref:T9SS type A sorting domain-containing protein n=1 Tax=Croceimicrobium hydrocarbonivorans TaxID=2761580 RepID=A0A7H0VD00_9FLAO|nr:T9SS type A sorting domain-containing protein [Croceimicrobium hydrocarbonivorans]QNR23598.1 T9SS type A sorting domain-containing protein [Croceimicrobium hydrocarbonivorans]
MKSASLLLALLLCMPRVFAQHGEAILTGIVLESGTEDTISLFYISIKNQETGQIISLNKRFGDSTLGYQIDGIPPGIYNLSCYNFYSNQRKRILNVRLHEGFNNWYPRIEEPVNVEFVSRSPRYYPEYILDSEDFPEFKPLSLYPNPVHETAALAEGECYNRVDIYNVSGNLIKTIHFEAGQEQKMELSDLPFGFYICKASSDKFDFSETVKFIKL